MDSDLTSSVFNTGLKDCDSTPEQRLWAAVLVRHLQDLELAVDALAKAKPDKVLRCKADIHSLVYEANSEWCKQVCDWAKFGHRLFKTIVCDVINGKKRPSDYKPARMQ